MTAFLRSERHSSAILLACAVFGLVLANTAFGPTLIALRDTHLAIEPLGLDLSLGHWISDLLLAIFFFIVATELKAELTHGELSSVRKALVPVIAAVGGVIVPALIYLTLSGGGDAARGWPIPTATDIAFAVGVIAVFGRHLPTRMRVFLLALAVIDDLIGIVIIATVFARDIQPLLIVAAVVSLAAFAIVSRVIHRRGVLVPVAIALALLTWYLVAQSGVHPTIAGVALGLVLHRSVGEPASHALTPLSNGLVLPLFAFTAALVAIPQSGAIGPVFLGLAVALPVGKAIGITIGGVIGARVARAHTSSPILGWDLFALAVTGGLGFTVALLVNQLAFDGLPQLTDEGVLGVLTGSGMSLVAGAALISWRSRVHR